MRLQCFPPTHYVKNGESPLGTKKNTGALGMLMYYMWKKTSSNQFSSLMYVGRSRASLWICLLSPMHAHTTRDPKIN